MYIPSPPGQIINNQLVIPNAGPVVVGNFTLPSALFMYLIKGFIAGNDGNTPNTYREYAFVLGAPAFGIGAQTAVYTIGLNMSLVVTGPGGGNFVVGANTNQITAQTLAAENPNCRVRFWIEQTLPFLNP